ncbi:MAG: hypothetical protein WCO28_11430 [Bacteroidota bacterium]|jgi:hypothetical protein
MDIQTKKINFIEEFLRIQNEGVINLLEAVLKKEKSKLYKESLKPMTLDELNLRITEAEQDIKEGRVYTTDELRSCLKISL